MKESEMLDAISNNEKETIKTVCDALNGHEAMIRSCLSDFVASLCGVSKEEMMSGQGGVDVTQARWLFFYAYKYMTGDTCERIGSFVSSADGGTYRAQSVSYGISQMSSYIDSFHVWNKRWTILKSVIKKVRDLKIEESPTDKSVKIIVPKDTKVELIKQE